MAKKKQDPDVTTMTGEEEVPMVSGITAETLKANGLPIKCATFHRAVTSLIDGTPETQFRAEGGKKTRMAQMWYTPSGLLCEQRVGGRTAHKLIPLANVSDTDVL